jgi:hypothetical protein
MGRSNQQVSKHGTERPSEDQGTSTGTASTIRPEPRQDNSGTATTIVGVNSTPVPNAFHEEGYIAARSEAQNGTTAVCPYNVAEARTVHGQRAIQFARDCWLEGRKAFEQVG